MVLHDIYCIANITADKRMGRKVIVVPHRVSYVTMVTVSKTMGRRVMSCLITSIALPWKLQIKQWLGRLSWCPMASIVIKQWVGNFNYLLVSQ